MWHAATDDAELASGRAAWTMIPALMILDGIMADLASVDEGRSEAL